MPTLYAQGPPSPSCHLQLHITMKAVMRWCWACRWARRSRPRRSWRRRRRRRRPRRWRTRRTCSASMTRRLPRRCALQLPNACHLHRALCITKAARRSYEALPRLCPGREHRQNTCVLLVMLKQATSVSSSKAAHWRSLRLQWSPVKQATENSVCAGRSSRRRLPRRSCWRSSRPRRRRTTAARRPGSSSPSRRAATTPSARTPPSAPRPAASPRSAASRALPSLGFPLADTCPDFYSPPRPQKICRPVVHMHTQPLPSSADSRSAEGSTLPRSSLAKLCCQT